MSDLELELREAVLKAAMDRLNIIALMTDTSLAPGTTRLSMTGKYRHGVGGPTAVRVTIEVGTPVLLTKEPPK
jgi:hypothetical protein